ncbi:MAG: Glu/Leu/Phe/Val dehydrogenase [Planctomycetota bacterium]|nr:MAG: Glu/Leu/Phe/Val dehydrogenase [Planctomycetota bacterium]
MLQITEIPVPGYESVRRGIDKDRGLHAIIAVHSTILGPALGGMRLWPYRSEEEALYDVLRLSKGMTYKAACAGLNLGGGKSVVIADPAHKCKELFQAVGEFVDSFGGKYTTAEDVNTNTEDMEIVSSRTRYVAGLKGRSGNPSPYTAHGCFVGLKATLEEVFGSSDLQGKTVAIEGGAGSVAGYYAELIVQAGGKVILADIKDKEVRARAHKLGGSVVPPSEVFKQACDVYAPCALGGTLNAETIPQLRCKAVTGAANNQLREPADGERLRARGILYAPDYVVNAGGLINVSGEVGQSYDEKRSLAMMDKIYVNLKEIYAIAKKDGIPTSAAADRFAERRLDAARAAVKAKASA